MRDLDFLRDDHHAPIAYDDSRKGFHLTDPTFSLPPVQLTRREVFSFSIARKLLERFEGTPLSDKNLVFARPQVLSAARVIRRAERERD
jgi:predicted DNA-binding transcriptional regulator YafY